MQRRHSTALILDVVDLHEKDRIVTFLTPEYGKKKGVARSARARFSRYSGVLMPLTKIDVTWFEKPNRDLVRLEEVSVVRVPGSLHGDLEGILLGAYLAEHVVEFAQDEEDSCHLFRLLDTTIEALQAGVAPDLAARYFETWILRLGGIFPIPNACPSCLETFEGKVAMLPFGGEALLCRGCAGGGNGIEANAEVLLFLLAIGRNNLAQLSEHRVPVQVLRQVERLCGEIRRGFLNRELRSYTVMQRTLMEVGT